MTTSTRTSCGVALFLGACTALAALAARPAAAQQPLLTQPLDSGAVVRLRLQDGSREGAKLGAIIGAIVGAPMGLVAAELVKYGEERDPGTVRIVAGSSVGWAVFGAMMGMFFQRWGPAP